MHATAPRRAAALLLAVVLLAAAPAAVAADPGPRVEPSLLETLAGWIAGLFPGATPGPTLERLWAALGPEDDANGATQRAGDGPTAEPQLGASPDPDG